MKGIVLYVMILQGHHKGNEGLGWYRQRFEQIPTLKGRVRYAGEGSIAAKLAYPEDVDAPLVDIRKQLQNNEEYKIIKHFTTQCVFTMSYVSENRCYKICLIKFRFASRKLILRTFYSILLSQCAQHASFAKEKKNNDLT